MKQIPFLVHDITKQSELFGRGSLLNNIMNCVRLQQNINIIGERRFGKTCVAKTAYYMIREKEELETYPIFLDFKENDIKGTQAAYAYMIGALTETLYKDNIFTTQDDSLCKDIAPCDDWSLISEKLEQYNVSKIQKLLERLIKFFSDYLGKTILFIIDEYEHLFTQSLEKPSGFAKLRALSSAVSEEKEIRIFSFWLIGATGWDVFCCNVPGSGDANTISGTLYVTPIKETDFSNMWEYECNKIKDTDIKSYLLKKENINYAYEKSGGVPFYGITIGTYMMANQNQPSFALLNSFFKELVHKMQSSGEYGIIKKIAVVGQKIENSVNRSNLLNKGIIASDNKGNYKITIGFFKDYVLADSVDLKMVIIEKSDTEIMVRECMNLVENINNQRRNKNKDDLFIPVNDSSSLEESLRIPCYNKERFQSFTSALYRMYFERSKKNRPNDMIYPFFIKSQFAKCADIARHSFGGGHLMDSFEIRENKITRAELIKILTGKTDEPCMKEEWYKMQLSLLSMYKDELKKIFEYVKRN